MKTPLHTRLLGLTAVAACTTLIVQFLDGFWMASDGSFSLAIAGQLGSFLGGVAAKLIGAILVFVNWKLLAWLIGGLIRGDPQGLLDVMTVV
jgi:hypothetical protein